MCVVCISLLLCLCVCCVYKLVVHVCVLCVYVSVCMHLCVCVWLCETVWELTCLASVSVANGVQTCIFVHGRKWCLPKLSGHTRIRVGVGGTGNDVWAGRYS